MEQEYDPTKRQIYFLKPEEDFFHLQVRWWHSLSYEDRLKRIFRLQRAHWAKYGAPEGAFDRKVTFVPTTGWK